MNGINILGVGTYTPELTVTNAMYEKFLDTSDEWIKTRTGIEERRMSPDTPNYMMAAKAAEAAIADAGITAKDIDLILLSTCSPDFFYPSMSCMVQKTIGAEPCACMDINAACSGFIYALDIARAYLETDMYKRILIVSSERLSPMLDFNDRGSCILFGDGAGAAVVEKKENSYYYSHAGADGDMLESLYCKVNYDVSNNPFFKGYKGIEDKIDTHEKERYLQMDGKAVYKFAVDAMATSAASVCEKAGITIDDVDLIVPHQANMRIIQSAVKKMGADSEKVFINLQKHGNTSSACIPTCLAELKAGGRLKRGMKLCLVGFGAGLTYGGCLFEY